VTPNGWALGTLGAWTARRRANAAEVDRLLVVVGGLRIPGPLPTDDQHDQTSHRPHRPVQRLTVLLTAGLLVAAGTGHGRSTIPPPPATPIPPPPPCPGPSQQPPRRRPPPHPAPHRPPPHRRPAGRPAPPDRDRHPRPAPHQQAPHPGPRPPAARPRPGPPPATAPPGPGPTPPGRRRVVRAKVVAGRDRGQLNGPAGPPAALADRRPAPAALAADNPSRRAGRVVRASASQLCATQRAFFGYYHWQVVYGDTSCPRAPPPDHTSPRLIAVTAERPVPRPALPPSRSRSGAPDFRESGHQAWRTPWQLGQRLAAAGPRCGRCASPVPSSTSPPSRSASARAAPSGS
jgi:hypothetical protein